MAAPSLGQAIGLNVERRDIFAPAAKQLAVNLADIKAEKRRKAKEKEETASKFMSEMFKLNPDGLNRKVRPEAVKYYDGRMGELQTLLDNPEVNQIDLLKKIDETRAGLASLRDQSISFDGVDKLILSDPNKVPTPLRNFMSNKDLIPDANTQTLFSAYSIDYDPESNMIRSIGSGKMDVREELIKNKASADALLANMTPDERNKSMVKVKTMTGYDPKAFMVLKPDQQSYLLNLSNVMANNPSALNTISDEIIDGMYAGDINKYSEAVTKIIEDQYQKDLAAASSTPGAAQNVPKMLAKDAMNLMATEYMLDKNFPEYVQRTTSLENLNKTAVPKDGKDKDKATTSISATTEESHLSSEGKKRARELKMDEQLAIDISLGRIDASPEDKKKANRITQGAILGGGPTVSFQVLGGEQVTIGRDAVNPRKLWYDKTTNKFHLSYDKQVSGEQTSENLSGKDIVLTREQLKQLQNSKNGSVMDQLEQWDLNAKKNGVPTIDAYITSGGASRASGATTQSSGKKKKVF